MQESMNNHDLDMMKVTRTLSSQIEEKDLNIERYKLLLKRKKEEVSEEQKKIKETFENAKKQEEKTRDQGLTEQAMQIKKMSEQEEDLNFYFSNHDQKQQEIQNEENRFKMLLQQLAEVEAQGTEDIERQKQRINARYFKELEDYKKEAQDAAEKNISEIERNIQI